MKRSLAKRKHFVMAVIALLAVSISAGAVYAGPLLVMQPAYVGMEFYVHRPQGIPGNWYATFDGYPVWKGAEGVWFYGSYSNRNLIQTNYVVGAVVPSQVGIFPYVTQTVVHAAPVAAAVVVPVWSVDPSFMVLGSWRRGVDRVGILAKPSIPVAWKGMWPKAIYAWTGSQWYQMDAGEGDRPGDVLRNNLYLLTRLVQQNGNRVWQAPDIAFLANQTAQWGYVWMGQVGPNPQQVY